MGFLNSFLPNIQKLLKRYPHFFSFIKNRLDRKTFFGLPLTLLMISFIYALSLFLGVAQSILASDTIISIDLRVANLLAFFRTPGLTKIFLWITLLGSGQFIIATTLIVSLILWLWKKKTYLIYFWTALSIDILLNYFSKIIIHRNRPINPVYLESSFSFPSGHAMIAMIFYGFIGYILIRHSKNWARKVNLFFLCLTIILAIGFSRLYLGVHYLSDVWGGYLLSILVLITTIAIYKWRYFQKEKIENENFVASKKTKTLTIVLLLINFIFYIGLASRYYAQLIP